mmetsp:Transcript_24602/g.28155  ORF Transcript_24602/g.28155 Transcript_24602/m.28155 type:complete len:86 (-) Transcript_24602:71-328(-)
MLLKYHYKYHVYGHCHSYNAYDICAGIPPVTRFFSNLDEGGATTTTRTTTATCNNIDLGKQILNIAIPNIIISLGLTFLITIIIA